MPKAKVEQTEEVAEVDFEKSWNDGIESLRKSMSGDDTLQKAKAPPFKKKEEVEDESADEEPEDKGEDEGSAEDEAEDEGEEEEAKKSLSDFETTVAEEPEAEAAMDVEPFLRQLVKSFNKSIKSLSAEIAEVKVLQKAQATVALNAATLQKGMASVVEKIGKMPIPTGTVLRKSGDRFNNGGKAVDAKMVLLKSQTWAQERKISLVEAGMIEARANKNLLGTVGDALDQKVAALLGGES